MHLKVLLALFIIIGIASLLIFSESGRNFREKYLDKYTKSIGSYVDVIRSKFIKTPPINRTLELSIKTNSSSLRNEEFKVKSFEGTLIYSSISIGGQKISMREEKEVDFNCKNMVGSVYIDNVGKMRISGHASSVELNGMVFSPKNGEKSIEFNLIGTPKSFSLNDVEKDRLTLSRASGYLMLKGLSPLMLENDNLNILHFKGSIEQADDSLTINGKAERANLNGIDLTLKT